MSLFVELLLRPQTVTVLLLFSCYRCLFKLTARVPHVKGGKGWNSTSRILMCFPLFYREPMKSWMMKIWLNQHTESSSIPDINVRQPEGASHVRPNELHPAEDNIRVMCSREFLENHSYIYTKSPFGMASSEYREEDRVYEDIPAPNILFFIEEIHCASIDVARCLKNPTGMGVNETVNGRPESKMSHSEHKYAEILDKTCPTDKYPVKCSRHMSCGSIPPYAVSSIAKTNECAMYRPRTSNSQHAPSQHAPSQHEGLYQNTTGPQHQPLPANCTIFGFESQENTQEPREMINSSTTEGSSMKDHYCLSAEGHSCPCNLNRSTKNTAGIVMTQLKQSNFPRHASADRLSRKVPVTKARSQSKKDTKRLLYCIPPSSIIMEYVWRIELVIRFS